MSILEIVFHLIAGAHWNKKIIELVKDSRKKSADLRSPRIKIISQSFLLDGELDYTMENGIVAVDRYLKINTFVSDNLYKR